MAIRLSGLASGLDTEAIVGALVSAYSYKKDKYTKAQTKLSWKQEAWQSLNTKINTLYKSVGNLRYSSSYSAKKCTVSDTTKASVIASDSSMLGTQSLKIKKLAKAAYLTGAKLNEGTTEKFQGTSTLVSLGYDVKGAAGHIEVNTKGKTTTIDVDANTTISQFVKKLNDAGVKANFDEANQRIFVASDGTGIENDFKIAATNAGGVKALSCMGLMTNDISAYDSYADLFGITGPTYDVDAAYAQITEKVKELKGAYYAKDKKPETDEDRAEIAAAKATLADPENKKWLEFFNYSEDEWCTKTADEIKEAALSKLDTGLKLNGTVTGVASGSSFAEVAALGEYNALGDLDVNSTNQKIKDFLDGVASAYADIKKYSDPVEGETDDEKTAREASLEDAKERLANLLDDTANQDIKSYLETNCNFEFAKYGEDNFESACSFNISNTDADRTSLAKKITDTIAFADSLVNLTPTIDTTRLANRVDAEDSLVELNGAEFTGSSNSLSINGLTIECLATTANSNAPDGFDSITITTSTDTSGLYDTVKNFLSEYNSIINEMMQLYNADSAKDYEPLTDDEKAEMSDTQIEKWEKKIKDSVLRRDNQLGSLITSMTTVMMQAIEVNGKKVSWGTFGVATLGYMNAEKNKNYEYHIDGDSEDSLTSSKSDKLRAALAEDPDSVIEFMKQMTSNLYKTIDDKMASSAVSSAYTVYNDKEMASEYSDYTSLIKKWTTKASDLEESYYKKFANMEKTLSKMQSNSSSISSLFG